MARAKRTDRAEARRKYRAYLQAQQDEAASAEAESSGDAAVAGSAPARSRDQRPQPTVQPGVRMGIVAAARAAYRTPHYRDDLRNIRSLVFGSHAVWPVLAICVAAGVYVTVQFDGGNFHQDPIWALMVQFLFYPVPFVPPMLAGFLAPRATWLAGMIASFISTATFLAAVTISGVAFSDASGVNPTPSVSAPASPAASESPSPTLTILASPSAAPSSAANPSPSSAPSAVPSQSTSTTGTNSTSSTASLLTLIVGFVPSSLAFGFVMGALSGWYKRFLALTSGPRRRPPPRSGGQRSGGQRSPQRRRPATR